MRLILPLLFAIICNNASSQTERRFFNMWGEPTSKDSSTYYKTWVIEKQGFNAYTYYTSNNQVKAYEPRNGEFLNGEVTYFHENGQVYFKANYLKGVPFGTIKTYYPNGQLQKIQSYDSLPPELKYNGPAVLEYYDSAGNAIVRDGNGRVEEYFIKKPGFYLTQGVVKNGLKDSVWVSYYPNGKPYSEEQWANGKFILGKYFREDGQFSEYTEFETQAGPVGGMSAFYRYVGMKMKYPKEARRMGIEGKVFVEFIVERDGTLSNIKVVRGISPECDQEAVRVVSISPKWKPGLQRGQAVRSKFNLAIIFKLG